MGKVRHRKRTRTARLEATATPLTGQDGTAASSSADTASRVTGAAKKEQEITNLLDKLRSNESGERVWASSTLSSLLLSLPPVHLRLLLSRNLIGLLIERLTLPLPSNPASPAAPPADDLMTAVESLGTLRNLAVSSPPHILSEMHNKRLLLPLLASHVPLLLTYLPTLLSPASAPVKPSLPATPADRAACDAVNEANETLRRVYWDWAENVLVLLWCLAESNTKILATLNAQGDKLVELVMAFLGEEKLGIAESAGLGEGEEDGGMDVEGSKKKKGKKDKEREKKALRVPLFVAVAAAQTLHAFASSNPACHPHLLSAPGSQTFSPTLSSLLSILLTPQPPPSASTDAQDYWTQLRVLSFGTLLEIAKGKSKRKDVEQVREILKDEGANKTLFETIAGDEARLENWVNEAGKAASEIDPHAPTAPVPAPNSPQARLTALERRAQTLQLALEILSEYLASGLSTGSSAGDADGDDDEEEEAWGGISMDVEDVDGMDEDDDAMDGAEAATVQGTRTGGDDDDEDEMGADEMLDDLADIAGSSSDDDDEEGAERNGSAKVSLTSLPLQLLNLSRLTPLSFVPTTSFVSAEPKADDASAGLISTEANASTPTYPDALSTLSEAVTTIHVRAIEALNNLFVVLAKGKKLSGRNKAKELQQVFEKVLEAMLGALSAHEATGQKVAEKKPEEGEGDDVEEKRAELVSAGAGVVWGCVRMGLDGESSLVRPFSSVLSALAADRSPVFWWQVVGPSTTPFLVQQVYGSDFASAPTPQGEAIRVRVLGALGWIGRRQAVPVEENAQIGRFLLSLLPASPEKGTSAQPSSSASSPLTPDALLQVIDSLIDLYADEEREYDVPNFRSGGMLPALESSVAGVRAAIKKIDRKKFPELRLRADGALSNMVSFVQYRKDVLKPKPAGRR
ncbi:hypothetical protein JCM10212_003331 [Sporobolomyces blumeae]